MNAISIMRSSSEQEFLLRRLAMFQGQRESLVDDLIAKITQVISLTEEKQIFSIDEWMGTILDMNFSTYHLLNVALRHCPSSNTFALSVVLCSTNLARC